VWSAGNPYPVSSLPALSAVKCAGLQGTLFFDKYHMALFRIFFEYCRDISNYDILVDLAEESGLDTERFCNDYYSGTTEEEVLTEREEYQREYEGWGIPLVSINDNFPIAGAVPIAVYQRAVDLCLDKTSEID